MNINNEHKLQYLDAIPETLYHRLVTLNYRSDQSCNNRYHELQSRVSGVLQLREYLLSAGNVTLEAGLWIRASDINLFTQTIIDTELLKTTENNESVSDKVILGVFDWLEERADLSKLNQYLMSVKSYKKISDDVAQHPLTHPIESNHQTIDKTLKPFYQYLSIERKLSWDLSQGIETLTDAEKLLSIYHIIQNSEYLKSIIDLIGQSSCCALPKFRKYNFIESLSKKPNFFNLDNHSISSITDIYHGDDISRILPSEMALFTHPTLKMLWYARRAEKQLYCYQLKGVMYERQMMFDQRAVSSLHQSSGRLNAKGPIILCLDTSASMRGKPELISKAVALQAMLSANKMGRSCYLYAYSGPDEIYELHLDISSTLDKMIAFLLRSYNGGTDINSLFGKLLLKVRQKPWKQADILLISDGRFEISTDILQLWAENTSSARCFGIQVSSWNSDAFEPVCQQVFTLTHV